MLFAAAHESGYGTNAKCRNVRYTAAIGGKAEVDSDTVKLTR
jgi:hypothetical protein